MTDVRIKEALLQISEACRVLSVAIRAAVAASDATWTETELDAAIQLLAAEQVEDWLKHHNHICCDDCQEMAEADPGDLVERYPDRFPDDVDEVWIATWADAHNLTQRIHEARATVLDDRTGGERIYSW